MPRITKYRDRQIRRILGEQPSAMLDAVGLQCFAVRTLIPDPDEPAKPGRVRPHVMALICRTYPKSDIARLAFIMAGVQAAETIYVFRDPDTDLEEAMLSGFNQCVLDSRQVIERQDTATDAPGPPAIA